MWDSLKHLAKFEMWVYRKNGRGAGEGGGGGGSDSFPAGKKNSSFVKKKKKRNTCMRCVSVSVHTDSHFCLDHIVYK